MKAILLLLLTLLLALGAWACQPTCSADDYRQDHAVAVTLFDDAQRNRTIQCLFELLDLNPKDGAISEQEFTHFKETKLSTLERLAAKWSWAKKFCSCGCNEQITLDDVYGTYDSCLSSKLQIDQAWKRLCKE
jgi:hypothetical protein